jgi:hypothetical protein
MDSITIASLEDQTSRIVGLQLGDSTQFLEIAQRIQALSVERHGVARGQRSLELRRALGRQQVAGQESRNQESVGAPLRRRFCKGLRQAGASGFLLAAE